MEKETLIEVKNISKKFCLDLKTSLRYGLMDSVKAILPFEEKGEKELRKKEFWAVKEVSFSLKRGECIGLIGHNGAGKSTLLKMINGLIQPDAGEIIMKGKVGALIELGAGFNPILTGRENIYNNAAVLGFTKKEIDEKMDAIIAFSEIEEFLDSPVQNYSSGMKVRLGFAVAAHLEPDILIVDEVLAVGDLGFVLKCFQTIDNILPNTAMVFVSHSMPMVARICSQIILLDKGIIKFQGYDVSKGIEMYYSKFSDNLENLVFDNGSIIVREIKEDSFKTAKQILEKGDLSFQLEVEFLKEFKKFPLVYVEIKDKEQRPIAGVEILPENFTGQKNILKINLLELRLTKGLYSADIGFYKSENKSPLLRLNNFLSFQMIGDEQMWVPYKVASSHCLVSV